MKPMRILLLTGLVAALVVNCAVNDETDIQALCENSPYIGEGALQISNTGTSTPESSLSPYFLFPDTFPATVKWARNVVTPITRVYNIAITGDSADVTITSYFHGEPGTIDVGDYGFFVDNSYGLLQRAITDSARQKVRVYFDGTRWRIISLTAANVYTVGLDNPISITEVKARVISRNYTFTINSANTFFTKDSLPTFLPGDTVDVTVTINVTGDSAWAFLHHGAGYKPAFGLRHHYRDPFYRTGTYTFERTWHIADDSVTYGVRHTGIDVVGWQTLFGDSNAAYYARAWALPYIVKVADQDVPPDTVVE